MKKWLSILIVLILLFTSLTGCWNSREIKTLNVVKAVGIDLEENGDISLSFQILKPSNAKCPAGGEEGKGGQDNAVWVLTSTGQTVFEAIRNATKESCRKLYFSFNEVIVIGEDAAKSGVIELTDLFIRDNETRRLAYILIAKGKAKNIIEASSEQQNIPAHAIEKLVKSGFATSQITEMTIHDFYKMYGSTTASPFAPGIKTTDKQNGNNKITVVELEDTAIFNKDKLLGWVNKKETRGFLWILDKVKSGIIVVDSPKKENKKVSLEIINSSVKIDPKIIDGKLFVTIKIFETGNIGEQMSENVDLTKLENFKELEKKQADVIVSEISAALTKIQKEWGIDIFNFGQEFHSKYPKEWDELKKNWDEEIKYITVNVEVEATLSRIGMDSYTEDYK